MKLLAILACLSLLVPYAISAEQHKSIPTHETVIELKLNARPLEVRAETIHRYRCQHGRLVAANEGQAARTTTRRVTLRCISD